MNSGYVTPTTETDVGTIKASVDRLRYQRMQVEKLISENESKDALIHSLNDQLNSALEQSRKYREVVDDIKLYKEGYNAMKTKVGELENDKVKNLTSISELDQTIQRLQSQQYDLNNKQNMYNNEIQEYQKRNDLLLQQLSNMNNQYTVVKSKYDELICQNSSSKEKVNQLNNAYQQLSKDKEILLTKLNELQSKTRELEMANQQLIQKNNEINQQLSIQKNDIIVTRNALNQASEGKDQYQSENILLKTQIESMKSKYSELETKYNNTKMQYNNAIENLKRELINNNTQSESIKENFIKSQNDNRDLVNELNRYKNEYKNINNEKSILVSRVTDLERRCNDTCARMQQLAEENKNLKLKLELEKSQHESYVKSRSHLINQFIEEENNLNTTLVSPKHSSPMKYITSNNDNDIPPLSPSAHEAYYNSLSNSLF